MHRKICLNIFLSLLMMMSSSIIYALSSEPWFTGPIIASSGVTLPKGHTNIEVYSFFVRNHGIYDRHSKLTPTPTAMSTQLNAIYGHGLSDSMDMQFSFPYSFNSSQHKSYQGVGDMQALLGYQVFNASTLSWQPSLRFMVQETIPTGRYDQLNPILLGTDANGLGSYATTLTFIFQSVSEPFVGHFLQARFAANKTYFHPVHIFGLSQYGGTPDTLGRIKPGSTKSLDLAGEFSITQSWVAVMEAYYVSGEPSHFSGYRGTSQKGLPVQIGHDNNDEVTFAPAIEYNFSAQYGIIAGYWYILKGKNTSRFKAPVIAFNAYW